MEKLSAQKEREYNFIGGIVCYTICAIMAVCAVEWGTYSLAVLMGFMGMFTLFITALNAIMDMLSR